VAKLMIRSCAAGDHSSSLRQMHAAVRWK